MQRGMAAVFGLVFLFVLASGGLLLKVVISPAGGGADASWTSAFALATFLALAWGVFLGLYRMARHWENEIGE